MSDVVDWPAGDDVPRAGGLEAGVGELAVTTKMGISTQKVSLGHNKNTFKYSQKNVQCLEHLHGSEFANRSHQNFEES